MSCRARRPLVTVCLAAAGAATSCITASGVLKALISRMRRSSVVVVMSSSPLVGQPRRQQKSRQVSGGSGRSMWLRSAHAHPTGRQRRRITRKIIGRGCVDHGQGYSDVGWRCHAPSGSTVISGPCASTSRKAVPNFFSLAGPTPLTSAISSRVAGFSSHICCRVLSANIT